MDVDIKRSLDVKMDEIKVKVWTGRGVVSVGQRE